MDVTDHESLSSEYDALAAQAAGEATDAEQRQVAAWITQEPGREQVPPLLGQVHVALREAGAHDVSAVRTEPLYQAVLIHAASTRDTVATATHSQPRTNWRRNVNLPLRKRNWAIPVFAGCAVALVAVGGWLYQTQRHPATPPSSRYQTAIGERATITLADGSRVTLGPATTLRVTMPDQHAGQERQVVLEGEAIFTVVPDAQAPFVVQAGSSAVRVLGTTFAVRKYRDDAEVRVAVQSGRVSFNTVLLDAGAMAYAAGSAIPMVEHDNEANRAFAWRDGRLVFRGESIAAVTAALERWYGMQFVIATPELALRRVNLTLDEAPSSAQHLQLLSDVFQARITRTDSGFVIAPLAE